MDLFKKTLLMIKLKNPVQKSLLWRIMDSKIFQQIGHFFEFFKVPPLL